MFHISPILSLLVSGTPRYHQTLLLYLWNNILLSMSILNRYIVTMHFDDYTYTYTIFGSDTLLECRVPINHGRIIFGACFFVFSSSFFDIPKFTSRPLYPSTSGFCTTYPLSGVFWTIRMSQPIPATIHFASS